jgi:hypothetical protein
LEQVDRSILSRGGGEVEKHFQFERLGFFVVDKDTVDLDQKLVFNLTVGLKDGGKPVTASAGGVGGGKSRKEEQDRLALEKQVINHFYFYFPCNSG